MGSDPRLDRLFDEEVFVLLPEETAPRRRGHGAAAGGLATAEADEEDPHGAHPAMDARYSRRGEDLLADIEREIDREIAGELRVRRLVSPKRLAIAAAVLVPVVLPLILVVGWPYYSLPLAERYFHPLHPMLRSSGLVGLPLGIVGLATMLLNLAYLVRKRLSKRLGVRSLPGWLRFHIVTGLIGPVFALLHGGFVPTSAMGLFATLSMLVVVSSGILGRYLLAYMPRTEGEAEALDEVRRRLAVYKRKLMAMGIRTAHLDIEVREGNTREPGLLASLIKVVLGDRSDRREIARFRAALEERFGWNAETEAHLLVVTRLCRERQWLMRSAEIRRLVVAWRTFHRWFAIVLFSAIAFHVGVALRFGWGN